MWRYSKFDVTQMNYSYLDNVWCAAILLGDAMWLQVTGHACSSSLESGKSSAQPLEPRLAFLLASTYSLVCRQRLRTRHWLVQYGFHTWPASIMPTTIWPPLPLGCPHFFQGYQLPVFLSKETKLSVLSVQHRLCRCCRLWKATKTALLWTMEQNKWLVYCHGRPVLD